VTEVTAAQVREVVMRIIDAGQWKPGDPAILALPMVADTGGARDRSGYLWLWVLTVCRRGGE
jgi:hypothetical protein